MTLAEFIATLVKIQEELGGDLPVIVDSEYWYGGEPRVYVEKDEVRIQ